MSRLIISGHRPISSKEVTVLRATLLQAGVVEKEDQVKQFEKSLEKLIVVSGCSCGCESLNFINKDPEEASFLIADGIGFTLAGGFVGILVFANKEAIIGLEVYDLGAGEDDIKLPIPSAISAASFSEE